MNPIKNSLPDQQFALKRQAKRPPGKLTAEDIARLSAKHEEIILMLRLWHGYSRLAADRVLSNWVHHNCPPLVRRAEESAGVAASPN